MSCGSAISLSGVIGLLTTAIHTAPECLRAQQAHQATTIPSLRTEAEELLLETFTKAEREILREILDGIED